MYKYGYGYKDIFYARTDEKFIEKRGIKWTCGKFDFYLVREGAWIAFEARSGCQVFWNHSLTQLKEDLESIVTHTTKLSKVIEEAIKTTGISPLYRQISLFE